MPVRQVAATRRDLRKYLRSSVRSRDSAAAWDTHMSSLEYCLARAICGQQQDSQGLRSGVAEATGSLAQARDFASSVGTKGSLSCTYA